MSEITLSKEKFLRASKKLNSILKTDHNIDFKLSQSQEVLSSILGFKNLHAVEELFKKTINTEPNQDIAASAKINFLQTQSSPEISNLICAFINNAAHESNGMWKGRANHLVACVFQILCSMRDAPSKTEGIVGPDFVLDIPSIYEYLKLDNLIKIYKIRKDLPENVKQNLKSYLSSLPGFQENAPKQNDVAQEQHNYLSMQIVPAIKLLEVFIDNSNLLIVPTEKVMHIYAEKYLNKHIKHSNLVIDYSWNQETVSDFFNESIINLIYFHLKELNTNHKDLDNKNQLLEFFNSYSLINLSNLINLTLNENLKNNALKVLINFLNHIEVVKHYSKELTDYLNKKNSSTYFEKFIDSYNLCQKSIK